MPEQALMKTLSDRESLRESLESLDEAAGYLTAWLEDVDARVFLLALRDVAEAPSRALPRPSDSAQHGG
jgi:hypothetical protein